MTLMVVQAPRAGGVSVESGTIVLWRGTAASLPSGWEIFSDLGDRYIKGASAPNLTPAGNKTHTHTNANTGSAGSHNHSFSGGSASGGADSMTNDKADGGTSAAGSHTHTTSSGTTSTAASHLHGAGDANSAEAHPPYCRLYLIKSVSGAPLPIGAITLFVDNYANRPSGFSLCDGSSYEGLVSPSLVGKFARGAAEDVNVRVTGGSSTHKHSQPNTNSGGSHSHTASGTSSGSVSGVGTQFTSEGGTSACRQSHSHSWSGNSGTQAAHVHGVSDTGYSDHLPPHFKAYFLMKHNEDASELPVGTVIWWDNAATIPSGWEILAESVGRFALGIDSDVELLVTGGVNMHSHTTPNANSVSDHNHGGSGSVTSWGWSGDEKSFYYQNAKTACDDHGHSGGAFNLVSNGGHYHSMSDTGSANHEPEHIQLLFIVKTS
jgi:uncharacterized protein YbdZ (MbtH family)